MFDLFVTQEHIDAAKKAGACDELPAVGARVEDVGQEALTWFEKNCPELVPKTMSVPLPMLAASGYGYGDGYGSGSGSGSGDQKI